MNITNRQLLSMHREIGQLQSSIVGIFLKNKIKQFYADNGIRIESLQEKISKLQQEYFVIENEKIKTDGEGKDSTPVMNEGKDKKEFDEKFNKLMIEVVNISI